MWTVIIQLVRDFRPPEELGPLLRFARAALCPALLCGSPRPLQPGLIGNLGAGQGAGARGSGAGPSSLRSVFVAGAQFCCAKQETRCCRFRVGFLLNLERFEAVC